MKVDTHTHLLLTKEAHPDWKAINLYFNVAKSNGLDAVCFTEHLDAIYYGDLLDYLFNKNCFNAEILDEGVLRLPNSLVVTSGAEVALKGGADVGLHVKPKILKKLNKEKGYYTIDTLADTVGSLTDEYIIVGHHLYRPGKWIDQLEEKSHLLDSIEIPAKDILQLNKYLSLGRNLEKPFVAGSDAHTWIQIGIGQTILEIENKHLDVKCFKKAIKENRVNTTISPEAEKLINISRLYRDYVSN